MHSYMTGIHKAQPSSPPLNLDVICCVYLQCHVNLQHCSLGWAIGYLPLHQSPISGEESCWVCHNLSFTKVGSRLPLLLVVS